MRIVVAHCSVDYAGRLSAHLPLAPRVLMLKADGSILVHSDGGSYKPLNWMSPPARLVETAPDEDQAAVVDRLRALGAVPADVGQQGDESWVVLADPEGNEFCVFTP